MELKCFILTTVLLVALVITNYVAYTGSNWSRKGHREYSTTFEVYITYLIVYTAGWGIYLFITKIYPYWESI